MRTLLRSAVVERILRGTATTRAAFMFGALAILGVHRTAHADPEPVRFAWVRAVGADSCASQEAMTTLVAGRFAKNPFAASATRSIDAYVARADPGYRVELVVRDVDGKVVGSREIKSDDPACSALESAAALAIALVIDPDEGLRDLATLPDPKRISETPDSRSDRANPPAANTARPPELGPSSVQLDRRPTPTLPTPVLAAEVANVPPEPPGRSWVTPRAGVAVGLVPRPSPFVALAAQVAITRWLGLAGEAIFVPEQRTSDNQFAFGVTAFSGGACADLVRQNGVGLGLCGSVWAGAIHSVVFSLSPMETGSHLLGAAALSPRLDVDVGRHVHLELGVEASAPFVRYTFGVVGWKHPAFEMPPVSVLPFAGVGVHFP